MGERDKDRLPEEVPQEIPRTPEEEQEPEVNHEIERLIIDDIQENEDADRLRDDRIRSIIHERDHPRTIH